MKGKTGTPLNYAGRAKKDRIPSDCTKCARRRSRGSITYCDYYDIFSPDRKTCARYDGPPVKVGGAKKKK